MNVESDSSTSQSPLGVGGTPDGIVVHSYSDISEFCNAGLELSVVPTLSVTFINPHTSLRAQENALVINNIM